MCIRDSCGHQPRQRRRVAHGPGGRQRVSVAWSRPSGRLRTPEGRLEAPCADRLGRPGGDRALRPPA
eukprot:2914150-Alexandrium_andersonii.AAC.1